MFIVLCNFSFLFNFNWAMPSQQSHGYVLKFHLDNKGSHTYQLILQKLQLLPDIAITKVNAIKSLVVKAKATGELESSTTESNPGNGSHSSSPVPAATLSLVRFDSSKHDN